MALNWSKSWALTLVAFPLLGAKGGCGVDDVNMGSYYSGGSGMEQAGTNGESHTGGRSNTSGGMHSTGAASGAGMNPGGSTGMNPGGSTGMNPGGSTGMNPGGMMGFGGTSPSDCAGYENANIGDEVTVRYRNSSEREVYLGSPEGLCSGDTPFTLEDESGAALATGTPSCGTCTDLIRGQLGCPTICLRMPLIRIAPGGVYETTWNAQLLATRMLAAQCLPANSMQMSSLGCQQIVPATEGTYTLVSSVWGDFGCMDGCSDCSERSNGVCIETNGFVKGDSQRLHTELAYPSSKVVEVVIE